MICYVYKLVQVNLSQRSAHTGNSALLPPDVMIIDFAKLPAQSLLAGNSSIDRCHVTSKQPMRPRSVGEKIPQTKQVLNKTS